MKLHDQTPVFLRLAVAFAVALCLGAATCGAPRRDTKKSTTRTELAKDFLNRHELERAEHEAERAVALDPENAEPHLILGLVDFLRALNHFRLLEIDDCLTGVDAEALRSELDEFLRDADEHFRAAIFRDPDYAEAHANRGNVASLLERYPEAIGFYEDALRHPHRLQNLGLTRANLGWARFHSGDDVGAAKELRQALQFNDRMCVGKYRMGRVYFARKEWNKALEEFQSVANSEDCPMQEAHLFLVKTLRALERRGEIKSAIDSCTTLAKNSCLAVECQTGM